MACSPIIILNAGCLDKEVIQLQCKGPEEVVYYQFSLANRIGDQTLLEVSGTANADDVTLSNITVDGQTFKCLISGGTIYHNVGIHFVAKTSCGETRTFNAVLPIRPEGVLSITGNNGVVIMGNAGVSGNPGENGISIEDISISKDGFIFKMSDGTNKTVIPKGLFIQNGIVIAPDIIGELPDDLVLNGGIYTAPDAYINGNKQLPNGLFLNSHIVMTDGSVFFPQTTNNNGVLCVI